MNDIENELHVLVKCPQYNEISTKLFEVAVNICDNFNDLEDCDKMIFC